MKIRYFVEFFEQWERYEFRAESINITHEGEILCYYIQEIGENNMEYLNQIINSLSDLSINNKPICSESWSVDIIGDQVLFGSLYFPDEPEFKLPRKDLILLLRLWNVFINSSPSDNASIIIEI